MTENALYFPRPGFQYSELTDIKEVSFLEHHVPFELTFGESEEKATLWAHATLWDENRRKVRLDLPADQILGPLAVTRDSRWPAPLHQPLIQGIKNWRKVSIIKDQIRQLIASEKVDQANLNKDLAGDMWEGRPCTYGGLAASSLKEKVYRYVLIQLEEHSLLEAKKNILHRLVKLNTSGEEIVVTFPQVTYRETTILSSTFNLLER